ncbi:hypothetical protein M0802_014381 [Mischocyttarus mexicanus]|nr:hypothetical protein M0802_014381 [Mischocyttarus mexicanus]
MDFLLVINGPLMTVGTAVEWEYFLWSLEFFLSRLTDTLKKRRRPLRKEIQIFGEIKFWSTVEKDYDDAWTRNCTFSARKTQRRAVRYEIELLDKKWSSQI